MLLVVSVVLLMERLAVVEVEGIAAGELGPKEVVEVVVEVEGEAVAGVAVGRARVVVRVSEHVVVSPLLRVTQHLVRCNNKSEITQRSA